MAGATRSVLKQNRPKQQSVPCRTYIIHNISGYIPSKIGFRLRTITKGACMCNALVHEHRCKILTDPGPCLLTSTDSLGEFPERELLPAQLPLPAPQEAHPRLQTQLFHNAKASAGQLGANPHHATTSHQRMPRSSSFGSISAGESNLIRESPFPSRIRDGLQGSGR